MRHESWAAPSAGFGCCDGPEYGLVDDLQRGGWLSWSLGFDEVILTPML